jgi:hypothetical protein
VLLALLFATAYVNVPWESLFGREFKDKQNYIQYLEQGQSVLTYLTFDSVLDYVTAEWLWHYTLDQFVRYGGMDPETFFSFISFALVFFYALIVLGNASPLYLLLLINPLVVDFGFTQFRHALAMVFIASSVFVKGTPTRIALLVISTLIHTSSVIFVGVYYVGKFILGQYRMSGNILALRAKILSVGLALSVVLGPFLSILLGLIGDRRAVDRDLSSTTAYLSIWILISTVMLFRLNLARINELVVFSLILLISVSFNALTGGFSLRILSVVFPFFLVMLATANVQIRIPMLASFLAYSMLQWLYWLRLIG